MPGRGRPSRESVYHRLDTQIAELWQRMGGLPSPLEAADIWKGIWFEEAHHSTAIEGNTLVLKQVEQLLAEGRAVGNKELTEYLEVRGYADAAEWVYGQAPGSFREHDIHPFPGGMTLPAHPLVGSRVQDWIERARALRARTPDFAEAMATSHSEFERIHPFIDGNGRTGRLVLNLLLVRLGYPPAIIYEHQRATYLRALRKADAGEPGLLAEFLARAVMDNLYKFVVPAIAGPARLMPLAALGTETVSQDALRTAAARGSLQATKGPDGQWRSCRTWVDEYVATRHRRRRD